MPQIWMTYDEIASMIDCTPAAARARAIDQMLDRRRSRDGQTRVKLDVPMMKLFISLTAEAYRRSNAHSHTTDFRFGNPSIGSVPAGACGFA